MCCTSIAPCWEQPALWGNICTLSLTQECFKHLHSLLPLELSSCPLLPPPLPKDLFSFLDPPIPPKFFRLSLPDALLPHTVLLRSLGVPVLPSPREFCWPPHAALCLLLLFVFIRRSCKDHFIHANLPG